MLAVSLHATTDEVRDWLVPVNAGQGGLAALMGALQELFPRRGEGERQGPHVLIEYIMLRWVGGWVGVVVGWGGVGVCGGG